MSSKKRTRSTPTPDTAATAAPEGLHRPAGMQHMGEQLYQEIRQAIVDQGAPATQRP